jgi:hypothetical protein
MLAGSPLPLSGRAPRAVPSRWWGRVVVDGANLRSAPSSRSASLGQLPTGSPVVVSAWVQGDQVVPDNPTWAQLDDRAFIYSAEVRAVDVPNVPTRPSTRPLQAAGSM